MTTFDLIRNNIFYRAAQDNKLGLDEDLFYGADWQQLEEPYWEGHADGSKANPSTHIEAYIARMLVAKEKKSLIFNRNSIFKTYKECYNKIAIRDVIPDMVRHTKTYQYLDLGLGDNPLDSESDFGVFHHEKWNNRDFYPVIFLLVSCQASAEEKQRMITILESYIIRRGVCGLTAKSYNKQASSICGALGDNPNCDSLIRVLKNYTADTSVFPDNERVMTDCVGANFYKCSFQHYVFEQIEKHMHNPHPEVDIREDLTIDHFLPQGWESNQGWKKMVSGADSWIVNSHVHTIGNLTLMARSRNSSKSNRSFNDVKKLIEDSELKLNRELAKEESWNVEKITKRSKKIGTKICEIWPYPDDAE